VNTAADAFAEQEHAGQTRKNGITPYISHPRAVVRILRDEAGITDDATLEAALLHDTIEDTRATYAMLVSRFGETVADVVSEVSDDKSLSKQARKDAQVAHAPHYSNRAALVKIADKIANMRDIIEEPAPDWSTKTKIGYYEHARAVVLAMGPRHERLNEIFETQYQAGMKRLLAVN
jgi:GTP diphosphokinase / guanosine-3',5'-bis(diphosphate) 3'-diphosphatase